MTPRSKIEALEADDTVADLVAKAMETGFSRFPIIEGDLDETIGIVHVKQVFEVPHEEPARTPGWPTLAQPVSMVPSTLDGDAVMAQIRANGLQTALVVDEYGGTAGMVTVEDLIEEIVGDVRDEHDDADARRRARCATAGRCPGLLRIDEVDTETPDSAAPRANTRPSAGWCCRSSATSPTRASRWTLEEFDPDTAARRTRSAGCATVRTDGRPPHRPARSWSSSADATRRPTDG